MLPAAVDKGEKCVQQNTVNSDFYYNNFLKLSAY